MRIFADLYHAASDVAICPSGKSQKRRPDPICFLLSILSAVGWAVGILSWVKIDAEERGAEVSGAFRIAIVLLGIFALCYYLFRTRGFVSGLKGIGWVLLYFVTFAVAYLIMGLILMTILVLAGMRA